VTYLPLLAIVAVAAVAAFYAHRQWGARGAIAVAIGAVTALAAFWPRRRALTPPPPGVKLEPVRKAAEVMITRREDSARKAIREADADELAAKMQGQE
jgi:hypothetical protein